MFCLTYLPKYLLKLFLQLSTFTKITIASLLNYPDVKDLQYINPYYKTYQNLVECFNDNIETFGWDQVFFIRLASRTMSMKEKLNNYYYQKLLLQLKNRSNQCLKTSIIYDDQIEKAWELLNQTYTGNR